MELRLSITSSMFFLGLLAVVAGDAIGARKVGDKCGKFAIQITQGSIPPLPNGIPAYKVEITNTCSSGCSISDIHVACGKFSSATVINPTIFKRLKYNDCLVNDGKPLLSGKMISFQYANSFPYTLSVSSVRCN